MLLRGVAWIQIRAAPFLIHLYTLLRVLINFENDLRGDLYNVRYLPLSASPSLPVAVSPCLAITASVIEREHLLISGWDEVPSSP